MDQPFRNRATASVPARGRKSFSLSLRRITTDGSWIRELDGLRFVAIASVVLYHILAQLMVKSGHTIDVQDRYQWIFTAIGNGDRGVRLFFVISGFVLGLQFARHHLQGGKPANLKKYFLRRVTRLEPPYMLNLIVCAFAGLLYYQQSPGAVLPNLGASLVYLHNLVYRAPSNINVVTWSLEVEIQFYILAPLMALLFCIRPTWARRLLFLLLIGGAGALQNRMGLASTVAPLTIVYSIQYFLAGMLLTDLYLMESDRFRNHAAWDLVSLCGWPIVFLVPSSAAWFHTAMPFLTLPLYIAAFKSLVFRRFFRTTWVAITGGMCYSIYLWHFFVIGVFFKLTRHAVVFHDFLANLAMQIILLGVPIAAVSILAFVLIERPCMNPKWPQDLLKRIRGTAPAVEVG
jgi:peptidoglycan/LPS O-acetylase OafA/YrhL